MKISENGLLLIKRFEGFSATPYLCPAGKLTIGYGHVLAPHLLRGPVTIKEAEKLLLADLAPVEAAINRLVVAPLTQNQFDALCSLTYNIGVGAFAKSTLLRLLNTTNHQPSTTNQFSRWVYGGGKRLAGLEKRRRAEMELFQQ
ncbi:MAG: lysozyme [Alphaproteobacteria bacterium]|nr:lysozyme [Alphaproteobacteria bacterium]